MQSVLLALLVCTIIIFAERVLIQLINISYHRKQFDDRIKGSKHNIYLLGILYDSSRSLFPVNCKKFDKEDKIIQETILDLSLGSKKGTNDDRFDSSTPLQLIRKVGRDAGCIGDKITSVFGNIASEITGKQIFAPNSAHSVVLTALERDKSAKALAERIWMSFVVEGNNELYQDDLLKALGTNRQKEAKVWFAAIDRDGNGDISLEEMILTVTEYARQRKSINSSMHDVDQAIDALDGLILTVAIIVCIFVLGTYPKTMLIYYPLTQCSRFPCARVPYDFVYVCHSSFVALFRIRDDSSGSPRFLHLPFHQASIRYRRPC
jgi:hypothetical protein